MENFLLLKGKIPDKELLKASFEKYFPESSGIYRNFIGYGLYLFKKGFHFPDNFYERNNFFIGASGTPFYKGLSYSEGLIEILNDELTGRLDQEKLLGHFYIFIWNGKELKIYNDGSGIIKAYYDIELQFLSSSFLVLTEIYRKSLTLNKAAILENIFTGGITGEETIINEIKEIDFRYENRLGKLATIISPKPEIEKSGNRKDAFENQISIIGNYFRLLKNMAFDYGADIGLTGGLDSRLLLGLAKKYLTGYQVHSHFRLKANSDLEIAREIANDQKILFISPEVVQWDIKNEEEKTATFKKALAFCDGQVRQHCFWHEEYNSASYIKKVLNGKGLSLLGIGGEQYRDGERILTPECAFEKWIYYHHIGRFSGTQTLRNPGCLDLTSYIKGKIVKMLGFNPSKNKINLFDLKRIGNEVMIPSYRGIRINSGNRISFCLSPFADFKLSHAAYTVIPFLNHTYNFEIDLIKLIAPDLSVYRSTYGFSFKNREPFSSYSKSIVLKNFIPDRIYLSMVEQKRKSNKPFHKGIQNEMFLKRCIDNIKEIDLNLDIDSLLQNANTSNMVFSLGFLLGELKNKIK